MVNCHQLLPPSHNIRDFKFLLTLFDHSYYSKIFEIIIYLFYLLYYLKYFKHNFLFFIFTQIFWIRRVFKQYEQKLKIPYIIGRREYFTMHSFAILSIVSLYIQTDKSLHNSVDSFFLTPKANNAKRKNPKIHEQAYAVLINYSLRFEIFDAIDFLSHVWPFVLFKKFK